MKIYELRIGDIVQQKTKNETILLQFRGCDGQYGKFVEVDESGKPIINNEINSEEKNMIFYACYANLKELNITMCKEAKINFPIFNKLRFNFKLFS